MVERRVIRVLVTYSKTHFFLDGGRQRGIVADALLELEKALNEKLGLRGARKLHLAAIPVNRNDLVAFLEQGRYASSPAVRFNPFIRVLNALELVVESELFTFEAAQLGLTTACLYLYNNIVQQTKRRVICRQSLRTRTQGQLSQLFAMKLPQRENPSSFGAGMRKMWRSSQLTSSRVC